MACMQNKLFCFFLLVGALFVPREAFCKFILVDVSSKEIYSDCHIKGAINIDYEKIKVRTRKFDKKNDEFVLYCTNYMCIASQEAAKELEGIGFKNVAVYKGGVAQWYQLSKEGGDFPYVGKGTNGFLSQKIEKPDFTGSDVKIIDAKKLREKLEEFVYSKGGSEDSSLLNKFFGIIESIKTFFSDLFGLD